MELLLWGMLITGVLLAKAFIPDEIFSHDFYAHKDALKIAIGLFGTLLLQVVFFAPLVILTELRESVRNMEQAMKANSKRTTASE